MPQQWHYARNGKRSGPVSARALSELARSGGLLPDDLVWREGLADWVRADRISALVFGGRRSSSEQSSADNARRIAWERLRAVAVPYRQINLALAWSLLGVPVFIAIFPVPDLCMLAAAALNGLFAWQISRLSVSMKRNVLRDVIFLFIPFLNVVTLAHIVKAAAGLLKSTGVKVGFLGVILPPDPPADFQPSAEVLALAASIPSLPT